MHTISETGCTNDVIATYHLVAKTLEALSASPHNSNGVKHPDLSEARVISSLEIEPELESKSKP